MTIGESKLADLASFNSTPPPVYCVVTFSSYSPASRVEGTYIIRREGSLRTMSVLSSLVSSRVDDVFVKVMPRASSSPIILRYVPFISALRPLVSVPSVLPVVVFVTL